MSGVKIVFKKAFSLTGDNASFEEIEERMRSGSQIYGTNLCVLMLAVLVASIGLNMNSTAVIIGAMLISPLMGTIMSIGYSLATGDFYQMRNSAIGLLFQIIVCLLASTIYFMISPISTAQSEILARTTPTIWDVLIAICGGTAGAIGMTRKESSNVIPGVAIATALMPPLCTAGFGIATGSLRYFGGAMYLFMINAYFIFFSTNLVMLALKVPAKTTLDNTVKRKIYRKARTIALILIIPSLILGYQAVKNSMELTDSSAITISESNEVEEISRQLKILYPQVTEYEMGYLNSYDEEGRMGKQREVAIVTLGSAMKPQDTEKMTEWLKEATNVEAVYIETE